MSRINTPINQVRLTNVATVRYTVGTKRFEIACYRNKVLDYRAGLETDLTEVLQTDRIFTNVKKGEFAAAADLRTAFPTTTNQQEIAKIILEHGKSLQVSDLERSQLQMSAVTQIAVWVAHNCVHPGTGRPYSQQQIKHALASNKLSFSQQGSNKKNNLKKHYLEAVKFLKTIMPIERAKMELALQSAVSSSVNALEALDGIRAAHPTTLVVRQSIDEQTSTIVLQVDPSLYRELNDLAGTLPGGRLEILQQVVSTGMQDIDLEIDLQERKQQQHQESVMSDYKDDDDAMVLAEKLSRIRLKPKNSNLLGADVVKKVQQEYVSVESSSNDDDSATSGGSNDNDKPDGNDSEEDEVVTKMGRKNQRKALKKKGKKSSIRKKTLPHDDQEDNETEAEKILVASPPPAANKSTEKKKSKKAVRREQLHEQQKKAYIEPMADDKEEEAVLVRSDVAEKKASNVRTGDKPCNTCGGSFTEAEYRAHFRTDWHRFNQKLKLKGIHPVSEEEFVLCDADSFFGGNLD
jgi:ribosome maturation protein SDO1